MNRILRAPRTLAAIACVLAATGAQAQLSSAGTIAVPTYESVGLYWTNPGGTAGCEVKFRKSGESAWRPGLAMWYDARDSQCRGSLVHLDPNSSYEVELNLPGQAASRALTFRTWSNSMPVAKTIAVNGGSATLNVAEGGSASGYVVYEGNGATLDAGNNAQYNVTINASYVIVRGLNLKGAKQDAIRISPNVTNVVIEDNDISGWGRTRDGKWGADMDSAIRAVCTSPTMERVTIQRNRMHDPRYSANSWTDGHPAGPQAVTFSYCGGNHVIRHNDMYSTNGNYFNDVIGGEDNFTKSGFPNADTDIYGNRLGTSWDDGIEAEGANENVRIWGNYIDRTAIGIATTVTSVGPVYIFRNVWNRAQMYAGKVDTDDRQPFFKSGSDASLGNGRRYVFHNTMLQARDASAINGLGGGFGMGGTGSTQLINNTFSKNNIYHLWKEGKGAVYQSGSGNEFAADLYNGTAGDATETGGISGTPVYASGQGWQSEAGGQYQLASSSPGYGRGVRIANFNDTAAAPDVGAHQSGTGAMQFGIAASPGAAVAGGSNTTNPTTPVNTAPAPTPTPTPSPAPTTPTSGAISMTTSTLQFDNVQGSKTVTYTNNSSVKVTFMQAAMSSARFGQTNTCGDVAPGASCTATVTYYPQNSGETSGTFTVTSSAPNSPHVVSLSQASVPTSSGAGRLGNISTRVKVLAGDDVMIGGFVIGGTASKTVVVRARGPSLVPFGIADALANPSLQLVRSSDQSTIAANDDWVNAANAAQISASGFAPSHPLESAILVTLPPGAYTGVVSGVGGVTGVGMFEVFEVDQAQPLTNISTRGQVRTGNDVMIGGFVLQGTGPQTVVVRVRGPSLVPFGIPNALANPTLQLVRSSDQSTIASNDDWVSAANAGAISATGFAPTNAQESAILVTLQPGAYTAIVSGAGGSTGMAIVEVFTP